MCVVIVVSHTVKPSSIPEMRKKGRVVYNLVATPDGIFLCMFQLGVLGYMPETLKQPLSFQAGAASLSPDLCSKENSRNSI